jgi:hypothetical protein
MNKQRTNKIQKVLATLFIIAAVFAGQQAFATVTETITIKGQKQSNGNISYFAFEIQSIWGSASLPSQQGSSYTFNNTNLPGGMVTLNGTLNFQEATQLTDVVTGSTFTVTVENSEQWFYSATVKTLSGTTVTDCSVTVSDDQNTITVSIPSGKTFGQIILNYVTNEPFNNNNTVIGGIESEYIYTGRPIEPVPTVTYKGTVLTAGTDYTVSYANNNALGTATLTVTGTGQYAGTISHDYNIRAVALSDFNSLDNNTYEIATTADLDHLAGYVKLGNNCQDLTFKQTADIAYTYTTAWNNSSSTENNYTAIGTNATPFRGTFDGQNYSISGIRVYYKEGVTFPQGLFSSLNNSTVKRVHLADARISGESHVGGIAGSSFKGTVEDCTVANNVAIHAVANVSFTHGGIVGSNQGTVQRCISHATLSVASNVVGGARYGGVVGDNFNSGSVKDCLAIGATVPDQEGLGAIAGDNNNDHGTLQRNFYRNCTVAGTANATNVGCGGTDIITNQGALALYSLTLPDNVTTDRTASAILPGTGNKTYTTGADINGTPYYCQGGTVTLVYNNLPEGYRANYTATGGTINGNILTMPAANVTVTVTVVPDWSGNGTQTNPYVITTTAQLDALANEVKSGQTYSGTYFVLGNDIAYSTAGLGDIDENFTTIGGYFNGSDKNFSGNFDGQNHTISGIRVSKSTSNNANANKNLGLFGRISGNATIQNVILTDARITGYRYVGGLVGNKTSGTVQNCLVINSTITCGDTYVGALFGANSGILNANHYHNCTVNSTANATNVGTGNGDVTANDGAVYAVIRMVEGYGESTESDHWTFISSPLLSSTSATDVVNLINTTTPGNYDLYKLFNTTWANYKTHEGNIEPGFTLENGQGYLYANKEDVALVFPGTYYSEATKEVPLQQGYNLVGNPFDGNATIDRNYYTMNTDGTGIVATAVNGSTPIAPCTGVIVQATGTSETVTFTKVTAQQNPSGNHGGLQIALVQKDARLRDGKTAGREGIIDNAIVTFNEGSQLGKFYFGEQDANLYISQGGEEYAIAYSNGYGEMPLNFRANENGQYTITVNPEGVEMGYLHLIDNMTGADVDLLALRQAQGPATYTFNATTRDYESRFRLVFSTNETDGPSTGSGTFAFISNGEIVITGVADTCDASLQVVDVLGHICRDEMIASPDHRVYTAGMAPGVYVLRLVNGNDVKVQKIVVK